MSKEYLKQIREQEEQADKIRRDALFESKRIVSTATEEAEFLVERVRAEAEASYKKALEAAAQQAEADYGKTMGLTEEECNMLIAQAEKNKNKAISVIVGKVVN